MLNKGNLSVLVLDFWRIFWVAWQYTSSQFLSIDDKTWSLLEEKKLS